MSFYVERCQDDRVGWVGPIRSEAQAGREAAAWQSCGWSATVHSATPEVRAEVRAWSKAAKAKRSKR